MLGISRTRAAATNGELKEALRELFVPLGPGLVVGELPPASPAGAPDSTLIAWRASGVAAVWPSTYRAVRTNRPYIDGQVMALQQAVPATNLRGKHIRLRGQVRAARSDWGGVATLRVVILKAPGQVSFADYMDSRPIRESQWREYAIEAPVASDATTITVGVAAAGAVTADFDALQLEAQADDGSWSAISLPDGGFEEAGTGPVWRRNSNSKHVVVSRPSSEAPEGRQFLRFAPPERGSPAAISLEADSRATFGDAWISRHGAHVDVDLGHGLQARVPLALSESEAARPPSPAATDLQVRLRGIETVNALPGIDQRLADIVVAWNVLRHFYPYWSEVHVDWDARLRPQLTGGFDAQSRAAEEEILRLLVADVRDGHAHVTDTLASDDHWPDDRPQIPVRLDLLDGHIVVAASESADAPVGAIVRAIDDIESRDRLTAALRSISGSDQWKTFRGLVQITKCTTGPEMRLVLDDEHGRRERNIRCTAKTPPIGDRPAQMTELGSGVWYVDLTRLPVTELKSQFAHLAAAQAVIFDVRGPQPLGGAWEELLPHLVSTADNDHWLHQAKIVGPFGAVAGWFDRGWGVKPESPRLTGTVVFLADAREVSYGESGLGHVADHRLGTIIGAQTAGTNGDIARIQLPGGFVLAFTGSRVTRHDGRTPFHLLGIRPDISVRPTVAGLRGGHDEVLDRAVQFVRTQITAARGARVHLQVYDPDPK